LESFVNVKKFASLSLMAMATLSLVGCSLSNNVASLEPYAPSDGVQVDAQQDLMASVQTKDSAGQDVRVEFAVKAGTKFDLGYNGTEPITFKLDGVPGQLHEVAVSGGGDPYVLEVPVMDGSLEEYRGFAEALN
jgi:hypothetical protein